MRRSAILLLVFLVGLADDAAAQAVHHRAQVRLWPAEARLEAEDRLELAAAGAVVVRLAPGLQLRQALLDGKAVPVAQEGGAWIVERTGPQARELRLRYDGRLSGSTADEPPFIAAEGSYLPDGTGWLPELGDAPVTFDLTVEVPEPHRAVATGRLAEETSGEGGYRARFVSERPGPGPSLFVGPYVTAEEVLESGRLRAWFYPEDAGLADVYLAQASRYLRFYTDRIGAYPYADFHIVAAPLPVGLGFPGLTYVSRQILRLPFMQTASLAHEILHSWWGNAVGVDYEAGNWAEGLTTYMADYALTEAESPAKGRDMRLAWLRDFNALPAERDMPLRRFVVKGHDATQVVGYNKAAFIFHMLRRRVGDERFDAALRRFYASHRFGRAGWTDLQESFAPVLADEAGTFFIQWLTRAGAPRLQLGPVRRTIADGRHEVVVTLRQDEPAYALHVPIAVETESGVERHEVALKASELTVTLPLGARPHAVAIDPDYDLFRRLAPGEAPPILRDITLNAATRTVIAASDDATRAAAQALMARLLDAGGPPPGTASDEAPLLVIGLTANVAAKLAETSLPSTPAPLAGRGTARVWTAQRAGGLPLLVIEADSPAALEALLRPLPHYRRDSYLVFDGGKAADRGVWPPGDGPLRHRFD